MLLGLADFAFQAQAQTLHRPDDAEPGTLDPQKMTAANEVAIGRDLFVGLITLDAKGNPVPGAAERWDISADGKEWVFHLRRGLKWSNGEALTSADFLYSFRRLVDPATAAADPSDLDKVVGYDALVSGKEKDTARLGVDAPDADTLRLHLVMPRLALRFLLADPQLFPLPKAAIERWGSDWTRPGHMVSNGPFRLTGWTPQSEIVLQRNPNFYADASTRLAAVNWVEASDLDAALKRFRTGELDWLDCVRTTITTCRRDLADVLHTAPVNAVKLIMFNMTKGPVAADVRLRHALNLALDRETLVDKILQLDQLPAYSLTPPAVTDYTAPKFDFAGAKMSGRLDLARQLMRDAGYGPDHHLSLSVLYPTSASTAQLLEAVGQMWQQIFVDVRPENVEFQVFQSRIIAKDYEAGVIGAASTYNDCEDLLSNFSAASGERDFTGYHSAEFERLFEAGSRSLALDERRQSMQQAEATALADVPAIPVYFDVRHRVINPQLHGMEDDQLYPQSRYLSLAD